jgi:hypothetical protein
MSTIPFDELVPGATVRYTTIDSEQYLSVRDVIMHLCGRTAKTANKRWERLSDQVKDEVAMFCREFQFPGQGNKAETVITFKGALKLAMFISGEKAAFHRIAMVQILSRYYAGDDSLTDDIKANAASTSQMAVMARNALAAEGAVENPNKRARVSTEFFANEISTLLRTMENGITGQLQSIAAGQEDMAVMCTQVGVKQDNIHKKLYELTNELKVEKARNEGVRKDLADKLKAEKVINEINSTSLIKLHEELRELSAELKARQNQIERQRVAIAHLNNTIRAKDAQLARAGSGNESIHQKLDMLLAKKKA